MSAPTKILRAPQTATTIAARQPAAPQWLSRRPPRCAEAPATPRAASRRPAATNHYELSTVWFNANFPLRSSDPAPNPTNPGSEKPPDNDRIVRLGKTLRILQDRLPTLLQTPLPQDILNPNITLHLFPATHPHLPVVTGRVAYIAALWSSPIAWNRVPIVGNVRLEILSERMVSVPNQSRAPGAVGEQLVVRWRTAGGKSWGLPFLNGGSNAESKSEGEGGYKAPVGGAQAVGEKGKGFTGLFFFDFDDQGRILSHTIEHSQESGQWEKGVGAKVVGLTDWLLGGMKGSDQSPCPAFTRRDR
ncbi:hypothetical protein QBC47DRAFT_28665 [Echria macrotheca]|uniref:Chromosome transmission fidelity protein 4 n=1 Tax=Echria macrotheca TaxID=438768 RepID=A0AAJ0FBT3_9PEZI|nr:hypothetical protein QBC47DRAFT_28665 [Echria macrotheca]